jgi:hypothetical protein
MSRVSQLVLRNNMILQNMDLAERLKEFETMVIARFSQQDEKIDWLFEALNQLTEQKNEPRELIGVKR